MCKELQGSQKIETQQAFKGKQEEKKKTKKKPTCKTTKVTNFLIICSWRNNSLFRTEPSSPHLQKSLLPESGILAFYKIISKGQEIKPSFTLGSRTRQSGLVILFCCYFMARCKVFSIFSLFGVWGLPLFIPMGRAQSFTLYSVLRFTLCWLYSLFTLYSLFSTPFCHLQYWGAFCSAQLSPVFFFLSLPAMWKALKKLPEVSSGAGFLSHKGLWGAEI